MGLQIKPNIMLALGALLLAACSSASANPPSTQEATHSYQVITVLPRDAIPSIDEPRFYEAEQADQEYEPTERVMGFEAEGQARAYPVGLLSSREIVNDHVAGRPIAVTW